MHSTRYAGVLVVDDDVAVREMLKPALRLHDFEVWLADNGERAVQVYAQQREHIDVALLDVELPGWDGVHTAIELRALAPALPICFMTGNPKSVENNQEFGLVDGAHVFHKPLNLPDLALKLHEQIGSLKNLAVSGYASSE